MSPPSTPAVPWPTGVDVHAHVLDPDRPAAPGARYDPAPGSGPDEFAAHLTALGLGRGVLVTASAHGTDNAPLLAAIAGAPDDRRGVAVVDADVEDAELDRLVAGGVVAVRVQDLYPGGTPLAALGELGPRLHGRGGHVEVWTELAARPDLPERIARAGCDVVIDHLGFSDPDDRRVDDLLVDLASAGHVWITVSGVRRHRPDLAPVAVAEALQRRIRRLVDDVPQRLLWASDWPHVGMPPPAPTPDELVAERERWFGDDDVRHRVLVENPARCYGFTVDGGSIAR